MADPKTSPGIVRMQAFIWEPHPILKRQQQDVTMIHSGETLKILPDSKKINIESFAADPPSIYLKPKYAYKSTFLFVDDTHIQKPEMLSDYFPSFGNTPISTKPGVAHQSFQQEGSLFSSKNDPTPNPTTTTTSSPKLGRAQWEYDIVQKSVEAGINDAMLLSPVPTNPSNPNSATVDSKVISVLMPYQVATSQLPFINTSSTTPTTTSTADNPPIRSVHWKAAKILPLFQGEDFVVEFHRRSYRPDSIPPVYMDGVVYIDDYKEIDPTRTDTLGNSVVINGGVVMVDDDGKVIDTSRAEFDLRTQPYYLIEMGDPSEENRYFIMIAGNSPRFIHVGKNINVEDFDNEGNLNIQPYSVSRCLSVFEDVSTKTLLDIERLRITVRNHLGKMVVIFGGYESNPWVIERNDLMPVTAPHNGKQSQNPADFTYQVIPIVTPESKISIFSGNMLCGFLFTPLHYAESNEFVLPQVIAVRGPVDDGDINMFLRENATRPVGQKTSVPQIYFQDAEVYMEIVDGAVVTTPKVRAQTTTEQQYNKAVHKKINSKSGTVKNSFLRVFPRSSLPTASQSVQGNTVDDDSQYVKFFYAGYGMGAGDYQFPTSDTFVKGSAGTLPAYTLLDCITPISTGWRLNVPAGGGTTNDGTFPVDVSQHVVSYNSQWQYTDAQRCDHNGSIRFWIYPDVPWNVNGDGDTITDQSEFLAALNDKTFFVRIYAWWDGGFMSCACQNGCSGDCCTGVDRTRCSLFTGLCHGGEINSEAGKRYMDCQLLDFWKILSDQQFLNSPFFDGMRDYNAVDEILKLAGFRPDGEASGDRWSPGGLMQTLAETDRGGPFVMPYNGETIYAQEFALPSSYDILQSPLFKFADSSPMDEAVTQIARISGKVAYFDRFGVFHLDVRPDISFQLHQSSAKANYYASPRDLPVACKGLNQLVLNNYSWKRATADVVNEIQLVSTTPEGALIIGNATNFAGKFDPTQPGYVGYTKRLLQLEGIFGSEQAVQSAVAYYKGFFIPPIIVCFEAYGVARLKAMDIIQFTGLDIDTSFPGHINGAGNRTVNLIITSLSHEIDPRENKWKSRFECEWIFTGDQTGSP